MKPAPFAWHAPDSTEAALALKAEHGDEARFLAGGQSLIPAMNFRVAQPAMLIDLNRIPSLETLRFEPDGTLLIGATCRYRTIERHPEVARRFPLLMEALAEVAHPQIRSRGTLGGNLAHADPASEMPAVMIALDARFTLCSVRGDREVAARDFFLGPLTTLLASDEMLAGIRIPPAPPRTRTAFREFARRRGDYAMCGVAAVVTTNEAGRCAAARLVFLGAGPTPMAAPRAAAALVGTALDDPDIEAVATLAQEEVDPLGSVHATPAYQRHLAGVLATRALRAIA